MAASTPGILRLPPEIMLKIAEYLPPDDNLSLKSAHSTLHTTVPPVRLYRHRKFPHCSTTLPPELIYEIADYLPPDCILALKLTHPILNATLPLTRWINRTPPSKCARLSIRTYLSKPVPRPSHIRCILCKNVYPAAIFSSSSSPACLPVSVTNGLPHPEVIDLPQRFCSWHVGRLTKIIHTGSGGRNEWISTMKDMCMHCGSVRGWSDCSCQCGSCGIRSVRVYTRYLNNKVECKRFWFWRNTETAMVAQGQDGIQGQLFVRESCFDPGESRFIWLQVVQ